MVMPRCYVMKRRARRPRGAPRAVRLLALCACAEPAVRDVDQVSVVLSAPPSLQSSSPPRPSVASAEPSSAPGEPATSSAELDPREQRELELYKQDLLRKLEAEPKKRKPAAPPKGCQPSDPLCD